MGWTNYLFSLCARCWRSYRKKMRKLSLVKYPILLIIVLLLSLKVWTKVTEILNSPRTKTFTILKDSVKYGGLARGSPAKRVFLPQEAMLDKLPKNREDSLQESLIDKAINGGKIASMIESIKVALEVQRLKTRNISSLKTGGEKKMRKQLFHKDNSCTTISRKGRRQKITPRLSDPKEKTQRNQPNTITVKSSTDGKSNKRKVTPEQIAEKRHVMLLKVHKCGSSSVQNIVLRFGYRRNLTFILAHDNKIKSESGHTNVISYKHTLSDEIIVPPPPGRHFDILCCHVVYNEEQFKKYLPEDTVYIGIVREPVRRLESAFNYFHMFKNVEMSVFANDPLNYDRKFPSMANNRMAFEYGFPKECFPPFILNISVETSQRLISFYLKSIDKKFDFIIINERMDESLVYMRRLLGWQLKDILYARLQTAKGSPRKFAEQDSLKLRHYLYLDYALYDLAVRRFKEKMENVSDDFQDEVKQFQEINDRVGQFCKTKSNETFTVKPSGWNEEFLITLNDCNHFSMRERNFIKEIRLQQYGNTNN